MRAATTFGALILTSALLVVAVGEAVSGSDIDEAFPTGSAALVQDEASAWNALPAEGPAAAAAMKHKMRVMIHNAKSSMKNQLRQEKRDMQKKAHMMEHSAQLKVKEVNQKTKSIKKHAKNEAKQEAKKAKKDKKEARKQAKKAKRKARKEVKKMKKKAQAAAKAVKKFAKVGSNPEAVLVQAGWKFGDMPAAIGFGDQPTGAKRLLKRIAKRISKRRVMHQIARAKAATSASGGWENAMAKAPVKLKLHGIGRRRRTLVARTAESANKASLNAKKAKAAAKKAKAAIFKKPWLGYSHGDAWLDKGGHYHLGANRRRIGAGFGRRRRGVMPTGVHPKPTIRSKKPLSAHRMFSNRYGPHRRGLRKAHGAYYCHRCIATFLREKGCKAVLYQGKRAKTLMPPGCRRCSVAASKRCLLKKKKSKGGPGARRRRRAASSPRKYIDAGKPNTVQCNSILLRTTTGNKEHAETRHAPKITLVGTKSSYTGVLDVGGKGKIAVTKMVTGHIGALVEIRLEARSKDGWYFTRFETRSCDFAKDVSPGNTSPGAKWQDWGCTHRWLDGQPYDRSPYRAPFADRIVLRRVAGECKRNSRVAKEARAKWNMRSEGMKAKAWLMGGKGAAVHQERLLRRIVTGASEARAKARASRRLPRRYGVAMHVRARKNKVRRDSNGCILGKQTWCGPLNKCIHSKYACKVRLMSGAWGNVRVFVKKVKKKVKKKKTGPLKFTLPTGFKLSTVELRSKTHAKIKAQAKKAALKKMFGGRRRRFLGRLPHYSMPKKPKAEAVSMLSSKAVMQVKKAASTDLDSLLSADLQKASVDKVKVNERRRKAEEAVKYEQDQFSYDGGKFDDMFGNGETED